MLQSALLFHQKFGKDIEANGFVVNPYDPCAANKMVRGKQHTITWHVDDLKSSHVDPKVNDEFIKWVNDKCGALSEVKVTRGDKHVCLGVTLDYSVKGCVKIDMVDYVQRDMLDAFKGNIGSRKVTTPANENLFKINRKSPLLSKEKHMEFHTMAAKGLFLTKRARPDIAPVIAFLCARVQSPSEEDWEKLCRMMTFLSQTKTDVLTLSCDKSGDIKWFIDASFAVHEDFKSHTGGTMTLGKGMIISSSTKQKINTRSSTEAELVGFDDMVSKVMWSKLFLEAQGYKVRKNIVFQDNMSTMQLAKNGLASAGKRSRHLNIRLFFMTDLIDRNELDVKCCPTEEMTSDFMTKPTQGKTFVRFRNDVMNLV